MKRSQTFERIEGCPAYRQKTYHTGQMNATVEVVYQVHLINGLIPIVVVDRRYLSRRSIVLRQLAASRPPFNVKGEYCFPSHRLFRDRFLRIYYLINTIRFIARRVMTVLNCEHSRTSRFVILCVVDMSENRTL